MKKITLLLSLLMTSIGFSQSELLTNGDFSNGDANWVFTSNSSRGQGRAQADIVVWKTKADKNNDISP